MRKRELVVVAAPYPSILPIASLFSETDRVDKLRPSGMAFRLMHAMSVESLLACGTEGPRRFSLPAVRLSSRAV